MNLTEEEERLEKLEIDLIIVYNREEKILDMGNQRSTDMKIIEY